MIWMGIRESVLRRSNSSALQPAMTVSGSQTEMGAFWASVKRDYFIVLLLSPNGELHEQNSNFERGKNQGAEQSLHA